MTKSSNTQGNPYHDEEGKFTSPDAASLGVSIDDFLSYKKGGNLKIKDNIDLDALLDEPALKIKDNIDLDDLLSGGSLAQKIQFSTSPSIVKENIMKVLDDSDYINNVALNFNFNTYLKNNMMQHEYYYFDGEKAYNNCIVYELAYTLYPRKAKIISEQEYNAKMDIIRRQGSGQLNVLYNSLTATEDAYDNMDKPELRNTGCGLISVFRGLQINGISDSAARELKKMYLDGNPINPLFGRSKQNSGSLHYFSMRQNHFAVSAKSTSKRIKGIINLTEKNKNANIIKSEQLDSLFDEFDEFDDISIEEKNKMKDVLKNNFARNGYENPEDKATKFLDCFISTLNNDKGLIGLLSGAQALVGRSWQSEFDLYDLSLLEMVDD